jgi:DNA repair exonuclease SbcCD nuclease subunit
MKIQILSDLHNEFHESVPPIEATGADVVVLAGDIDLGTKGLKWAASEARRLGVHVVYVAGNHEFYSHDFLLRRSLGDMAGQFPRVHFLEESEVVIENVRFLGCTLWTDYRAAGTPTLSMRVAERVMNDHRLIRNGNSVFLASDAARAHANSRAWLAERLAQPFDGATVVVTHHGPHRLCRYPNANAGPLDAAFWSDLSELVPQADLWCCGHSHWNMDAMSCGCRLIANQRGYPKEYVPNYVPDLVVEL